MNRLTLLLKEVNWFFFTCASKTPYSTNKPRISNQYLRYVCRLIFRYITRPIYDWYRR